MEPCDPLEKQLAALRLAPPPRGLRGRILAGAERKLSGRAISFEGAWLPRRPILVGLGLAWGVIVFFLGTTPDNALPGPTLSPLAVRRLLQQERELRAEIEQWQTEEGDSTHFRFKLKPKTHRES